MKKIYFALLFMSFYSFSFTQNEISWQDFINENIYKIEKKQTLCDQLGNGDVSANYIFLKLTNKSDKSIRLSFQIEAYYNGDCRTCNSEFYKSFTIPANSSLEPNCKWENGDLAIIKNYLTGVSSDQLLTNLKLTNISVK